MPQAALTWIFAGYRAVGLDLAGAAKAVGLTGPLEVDDAEREVPIAHYAGLLKAALDQMPAFAARAAAACPFGTFPLLDHANAACATMGDAVASLVRYFRLVSTTSVWNLKGARLELTTAGPLPDWLRIATHEFTIGYTARRLDELAGQPIVAEVHAAWPRPAWAKDYPAKAVFDARATALVFAPGAFARPSVRRDAGLLKLLRRNAEPLALAPGVPTAARQVEGAVLRRLSTGLPAMAEVAADLGLSARTLRRRLAEEHATFERVRDQVLVGLATDHLRDRRQSIAEVAYLLGFSEARAFHRAFKRWTGKTPRRGAPRAAC